MEGGGEGGGYERFINFPRFLSELICSKQNVCSQLVKTCKSEPSIGTTQRESAVQGMRRVRERGGGGGGAKGSRRRFDI